MPILIDAVTSDNVNVTLVGSSDLLQNIPSENTWRNEDEQGRLVFGSQTDASRWLRKVVDYIPVSVKTFEIYKSFTDTIAVNKKTFTRPGRILLQSIYANEIRKDSFVYPKEVRKGGRPRKIKEEEETYEIDENDYEPNSEDPGEVEDFNDTNE